MKINRLKGRKRFGQIYRSRYRITGEFLKVFFLPGGKAFMGITTPRYGGIAVERNRVKRIIRETYRNEFEKFPDNGSILFLLRKCGDRKQIVNEMFDLTRRVTSA